MNRKLFNVFLFTAGAAIGSLVTWKVLQTRYDQLIQEEVDAFKKDYARCMSGNVNKNDCHEDDAQCYDDADSDDEDVDAMVDYHKLASKYTSSGEESEDGEEGDGDTDVPYINGPYVITPDEFGDGNYDYDMYCLTYYSDGILANDWDEELDIDDTIGLESLEHFGDHAEDVVHVRNERLRADYEVVRDCRKYTEMLEIHSPTHAYAD